MNGINCNGLYLDLATPRIMGILNLTPDSFYDGSKFRDIKSVLDFVKVMKDEGMDILDIGAVSTKPGASFVGYVEERKRLIPILESIRKTFPELIVSIDSSSYEIIKECTNYDINIVNDISANEDSRFLKLIRDHHLTYILMHMQNTPKDMQVDPHYENVTLEVLHFFKDRVSILRKQGITDLLIDPGFGFGKSITHNYKLLNDLSVFKLLECPILVGISRKSMIFKLLSIDPNNALNGTTALHMISLLNGTKILRVHDVKEANECIKLYQKLVLSV